MGGGGCPFRPFLPFLSLPFYTLVKKARNLRNMTKAMHARKENTFLVFARAKTRIIRDLLRFFGIAGKTLTSRSHVIRALLSGSRLYG